MIPFDEAFRLVAAAARPLGGEAVPLAEASGRVLAAPVTARVDSPPADCSAMDGYAVREADLPGTLRLVGESFPGGGFGGAIGPGSCVHIFTGAPVPAGADRIVIQEVAARMDDRVTIAGLPGPERFIRRHGSDFRKGDLLLEAGRRLDPKALVAAAAADLGEVTAWRRPAVIVLGTGDELVPPGQAGGRPGAIPDSLSLGLAALVEQWGGRSAGSRLVGDDLETLERVAAGAAGEADLVVVTGGASVGERDHARAMFAPHGLDLIFSKVAMRPGKPVWLGRVGKTLVLGLPGNPTSAMVTARLLLAPLVAGLAGRSATLEWRPLALGAPIPACGDRETFHRARLRDGHAVPIANQDSGAQKALAEADLLLRSRPGDPARAAGQEIEALDF